MDSKAYFFGVPTGFETFPTVKRVGYYQQFYERVDDLPWRFLVRQNKNIVRYIYIRYGLLSHSKRPQSLFGISLELKDFYIDCVNEELIGFLNSFFNEIVEDEILFSKKGKVINYKIGTFKEVASYMEQKLTILQKIPELLEDNLILLETNKDVFTPKQIAQIGYNVKDEVLSSFFLKYGGINILPSVQSIENIETPKIVKPFSQETAFWDAFVTDEKEIEELKQELAELKQRKIKPSITIHEQLRSEESVNQPIVSANNATVTTDIPQSDIPKPKVHPKWFRYAAFALLAIILISSSIYFTDKGTSFLDFLQKPTPQEPDITSNTKPSPPVISEKKPLIVPPTEPEKSEAELYNKLTGRINGYLRNNKFSKSIRELETEQSNFPEFTREINIRIAKIKKDRQAFRDKNNQIKYESIIKQVNSHISNHNYMSAMQLLKNGKQKFPKHEVALNEAIVDLCNKLLQSVNWYTNQAAYESRKTETWRNRAVETGCYETKIERLLKDHQIFAGRYKNYKSTGQLRDKIDYGYYKKELEKLKN